MASYPKRNKAYREAAHALQVAVWTDESAYDAELPSSTPSGVPNVSVSEVCQQFGAGGMSSCRAYFPNLSDQQILDSIAFAGRILEWLEEPQK